MSAVCRRYVGGHHRTRVGLCPTDFLTPLPDNGGMKCNRWSSWVIWTGCGALIAFLLGPCAWLFMGRDTIQPREALERPPVRNNGLNHP